MCVVSSPCHGTVLLLTIQGGSFMQEVVDEIVKLLTSEDYRGKMVVILAGYEADMDTMLTANQGLRSRFPEKIRFDDLSDTAIADLFVKKATSVIRCSAAAAAALPSLAGRLRACPGFSNGRDVETWVRAASRARARRGSATEMDPMLEEADLVSGLETLVAARPAEPSPTRRSTGPPNPLAFATQSAAPPPPPATTASVATAAASAPPAQEEDSPDAGSDGDLTTALSNPFAQLPVASLAALQVVCDELGLSSAAGMERLLSGGPQGALFEQLATALAARLNMASDTARQLLREWMQAQATVKETQKAVAKRKLRPIWRCGVCGQADMPYIACYVAPFIVRYDTVPE